MNDIRYDFTHPDAPLLARVIHLTAKQARETGELLYAALREDPTRPGARGLGFVLAERSTDTLRALGACLNFAQEPPPEGGYAVNDPRDTYEVKEAIRFAEQTVEEFVNLLENMEPTP